MTEIVDDRQRLVARLRGVMGGGGRETWQAAADMLEQDCERERDLINGLASKSQIALQSASARIAALEGLLSEIDLVDAGDRALIAVKSGSGRSWVRRVTAALASPSEGNKKGDAMLGRFNHHPDPAIDFCVEVDVIEGLMADLDVGLADRDEVAERVARAHSFVAGVDDNAKAGWRKLDAIYRALASRPQERPRKATGEMVEVMANLLREVRLVPAVDPDYENDHLTTEASDGEWADRRDALLLEYAALSVSPAAAQGWQTGLFDAAKAVADNWKRADETNGIAFSPGEARSLLNALYDAVYAAPPSPQEQEKPPFKLTPLHLKLLRRGARGQYIGLTDDMMFRHGEMAALGELTRAGLAEEAPGPFPPGPPRVTPSVITEAGRAVLAEQEKGEQT